MGILRRRARPTPDEPAGTDQELAELAGELAGGDLESGDTEGRARAGVRRMTHSLARGTTAGGRLLADRLLAIAPRIPVRDLATLRRQYPGALTPDALADRLVIGACRATAAIGAGVGVTAVVPTAAITAELAAELLAVAAVEVKLIAELHEVYGQAAPGGALDRTTAYLGAWAGRRGIDSVSLLKPTSVLAMGAGARVRRQVSRRLARGSLRRLPSLAPFMLGSALGAHLNRRDTSRLAGQVRADLRNRTPRTPGYWEAAEIR